MSSPSKAIDIDDRIQILRCFLRKIVTEAAFRSDRPQHL